ncbi:MAG TPA: glycosyl hydrolase-related protein, partial [Candidatus Lokiarchaeia archaeon]|nr:glycosyl hydrolase-related protein [Candidatus Lokiarchaeia archaeon]
NAILTTLKQSEEGRVLIMRVFNPTEIPQETEISLGFPVEAVQYVNLVEELLAPEDENLKLVDQYHVDMLLPAKKIVSCLLQPA